MDEHLKSIDKQIEFNQGKNVFLDDNETKLRFVDETIKAISNIGELNPGDENILTDYATDKAIEEFCRINQYYTFNSQAKNDLREIYRNLFSVIKAGKSALKAIEKDHYENLKRWLQKTNPFAEKIYAGADRDINPVACSEYGAELQLDILHLDIRTLTNPVLDIGCGKHGTLVGYFRQLGFDATGIDRFTFPEATLINSDWLEFAYGTEKWGTITSNLGFSNHFKHHNLRDDGNYMEYARKYMDILKSLKTGGKFHYAPDLPFIERYLDHQQFEIEQFEIGGFDFKTTVIKRLK